MLGQELPREVTQRWERRSMITFVWAGWWQPLRHKSFNKLAWLIKNENGSVRLKLQHTYMVCVGRAEQAKIRVGGKAKVEGPMRYLLRSSHKAARCSSDEMACISIVEGCPILRIPSLLLLLGPNWSLQKLILIEEWLSPHRYFP